MRRWAFVLVGAAVVLLAVFLWRYVFSIESRISHHRRAWHHAVRAAGNGTPIPGYRRLFTGRSPASFWLEEQREHRRALTELGYLTQVELKLTNQVLTREFSKNFDRRVLMELGTNTDKIWMVSALPGGMGLHATIPVNDIATWERIFLQCAALYASNLPPATMTNPPLHEDQPATTP